MIELLQNLKSQEFIGVKELSDAAVKILRQVGPSQEKATVAEYPNERTIRYYLSEGLLPSPSDKRSQASVFSYEHLLTLLVIKKLQADGLPISIIRTLLGGKDIPELERLLGEQITVFTDRQALYEHQQKTDDLESLNMVAPEAEAESMESVPAASKNEAKSFLESLLSRRTRPSAPLQAPAMSQPLFSIPSGPATPATEEWKRYQLAPGLELHVEKKFQPPTDKAARDRIFDLIKRILRIPS